MCGAEMKLNRKKAFGLALKMNMNIDSGNKRFYKIQDTRNGLVDVWLTPGEAVPAMDDLTGRTDYNFRLLAVRGIDPQDEQWGGDLEEHIRRHYEDWIQSAEVIVI